MAPEDLFSGLPSEIIIAILSRLSVRAVAVSKCVCKAWLDLLGSDYFLDSYHHSKSAAALAVMLPSSDHYPDWWKVFEVEDGVDDLQSNNPMTEFGPPYNYMDSPMASSANGLVFLYDQRCRNFSFVYNPITREYIKICAREEGFTDAYGFGASKVSGEFKVVRFEFLSDYCYVYTLGTAGWRRFQDATAALIDVSRSSRLGAFVDGNLYWRIRASDPSDSVYKDLIVCFDLETERFSTFPSPPIRGCKSNTELFTLKDCLCFLDDTDDDGIGLWLLKACGVEKSWRKECVMKWHPGFGFPCLLLQPIKVFENGDILVLCDQKMFLRYFVKNKTYQEIQSFGAIRESHRYTYIYSSPFTPSFRSLESFAKERVISY